MRKIIFPIGLSLFLLSCASNTMKSDQDSPPGETQKIMIPQSNCFASMSEEDSIWLKIEIFPNAVTGVLKYQLSGKDKNEGTIDGKMEGNELFADYTFISEGIQSVREVAFLIDGDSVTEGFGDVEEKDGKMVFKDRSKIDFSRGIKFNRINCEDNDVRFQIR